VALLGSADEAVLHAVGAGLALDMARGAICAGARLFEGTAISGTTPGTGRLPRSQIADERRISGGHLRHQYDSESDPVNRRKYSRR
jgi:hypothetical protein